MCVYVHPFYDGNGRTARFLSANAIKNELDKYSAISFSRACYTNHVKYGDLFAKTNLEASRGELNYFIEGFFDLLKTGQKEVINDLKEKSFLLESARKKVEASEMLSSDKERTVLYALAQHFYFSLDEVKDITSKDLFSIFDSSTGIQTSHALRNVLQLLALKELVLTRGKRPYYYRINPEFLAE